VPICVPKTLAEPLRQALTLLRLRWPTTEEALRAAFRKKALLHHPDRGGDPREFGALQAARDHVARVLAGELPALRTPPPACNRCGGELSTPPQGCQVGTASGYWTAPFLPLCPACLLALRRWLYGAGRRARRGQRTG
jgi:hypothetical protein